MDTLSGRQEPETGSTSLATLCVISARKRKRAYHRIMSGLQANGAYKFLTLTSSPDSPEDMQRSWRKLIMRLQRRGLLKDGYIRVTEYTHAGRPHYHIIFRGDYIEQRWISSLWALIHQAPIVYITRVHSKRGISGYLGKYLAKDMQGRLSWSYPWVYKGFVRAWVVLKRIGREYNIDRRQVLHYWQTCCKVRQRPREVTEWLLNESYAKLPVKSAVRHTAVPLPVNVSRQYTLIM
ncbi:hypothetical protein ES705_43316 [subsurface metagenome]